jgi:uncharacterized membrane protein
MATQDERTQGLLCWLLSLVPGVGILSPIVFLVISKQRSFVYANAAQCLVMIVGWNVIVWIVAFVTCGTGAVGWVIPIVLAILGAAKANSGEVFEPPLTGPLAKNWFRI